MPWKNKTRKPKLSLKNTSILLPLNPNPKNKKNLKEIPLLPKTNNNNVLSTSIRNKWMDVLKICRISSNNKLLFLKKWGNNSKITINNSNSTLKISIFSAYLIFSPIYQMIKKCKKEWKIYSQILKKIWTNSFLKPKIKAKNKRKNLKNLKLKPKRKNQKMNKKKKKILYYKNLLLKNLKEKKKKRNKNMIKMKKKKKKKNKKNIILKL